MSNYANVQYNKYIDSNGHTFYVPISIIDNNTYNYNTVFYNSSNNQYSDLPEPEITPQHQIPYQTQYNNNNYFNPSYTPLYNTNSNPISNYTNNNYIKPKEDLTNISHNSNSYHTQNNFIHTITPDVQSHPTVTKIKPVTQIPSHRVITPIKPLTQIKSSSMNTQRKKLVNNIDNNLEFNFNNQNYPLNSPINRNIQIQNEKRTNVKIINNGGLVKNIPTEIKSEPNILLTPQVNNIKNNISGNISNDLNRQVKDSETRYIPIPNNIKKNNINSHPNNFIYNKNTNIKMPLPPNNTNIINEKKYNNNIITNPVQTGTINNNNKINFNNVNANQEKQIISNAIINNTKNQQTQFVNQTNTEKKPLDNTKNGWVDEVAEGITNIEIVPKNTIKYRPLTQKDYDEIFIKGVGIINLGNTCFINSCLQALIHCKLFMQTFFKMSDKLSEEKTPISYNFLLICILMLDIAKLEGVKYIDISYFKYIFGKKHPIFNGYNQNDSQEFCRIFLEDLSNELNEVKNKGLYKALTNSEGKAKIFRDNEFDLNFKEREKSIIIDLFYSQIITTFTCRCGSEIYSFQKLLDFPLLLPENVNSIDINDLFKIYFKTEVVDFESKCEKCNKIEKHKKAMNISRPPEILIISLQRINESIQKKNECLVTFPELLNLYEFIDHDIGFDKEYYYQLFSIINHQGNISGGHYYTYVKPLQSNNWYEFNDSSVRQIKIEKNIFPYAYALFYIKYKYQ